MFIKYQVIYLVSLLLFTVIGVTAFKKQLEKNKINIKKDRYKQFHNLLMEKIDENKADKMLQNAGLKISGFQYQMFRFGLIILFILFNGMEFINKSHISIHTMGILIFLTMLSPRDQIGGKRTLFKIIVDYLAERIKRKQNEEINRALSQLKTLAIIKEKKPPGTLFILDQINKFTKVTRPVFNELLSYWSMGKKEEGLEHFKAAIDTPEAKQIASIISKLDGLSPIELKNQLILYQQNYRRERESDKIKENQDRSNFAYFFVISSALIVISNFVIVSYYIEYINLKNYF